MVINKFLKCMHLVVRTKGRKTVKSIQSYELREMYLRFFKEKGHSIIPSASLIPENDPTVLFTTAGMHPLIPYLMGAKHPEGVRLVDVQKCVRTGDIDEVGDSSHCTFFEMLGNWSLGDYFKKEAIAYSWEFLTSEDWLGIDQDRLYFTCFEGDEHAPRDEESANFWKEHGVADDHIFFLAKEHNWWGPAGLTGPCGPDTEMFIDTGKPACGVDCSPACSCGKYLEIWNDVFMQYNKTSEGAFEPLQQKNVDTGMGLDRTIAVLQGVESVYDTDIFEKILAVITELADCKMNDNERTLRAYRIVADHMRCATFMIGDPRGITPSNMDQGYVLRRLLRRAIRWSLQIGIAENQLYKVALAVIDTYGEHYTELLEKKDFIVEQIQLEEKRFVRTINQGIKEFDRLCTKLTSGDTIDGKSAFRLYDTYGFPIEMTVELAEEKGMKVDEQGFDIAFAEHQKKSQAGAEQRFKGGLADTNEQTARLHTATHLLQAALRQILGDEVAQKGSNITAERLRFDFSFPRKVTREELDQVEAIVNEAIAQEIDIVCSEMSVDEAKSSGAIGLFDSKYGNIVKVYTVGDVSKEICGGPHAENTSELISFKIKKEEASSAGVRRIKAVIGAK